MPGLSSTLKCIIIILFTVAFVFICKKIQEKRSEAQGEEARDELTDFTLKLSIAFICFIPVLFFMNQIMRLPREMLVFVYIVAANTLGNGYVWRWIKNNVIIYLGIAALIFGWSQTFIFSIGVTKKALTPLFEKNTLIDMHTITVGEEQGREIWKRNYYKELKNLTWKT